MVSYFRSSNNKDFLMKGLSTDIKPTDGIPNGAVEGEPWGAPDTTRIVYSL